MPRKTRIFKKKRKTFKAKYYTSDQENEAHKRGKERIAKLLSKEGFTTIQEYYLPLRPELFEDVKPYRLDILAIKFESNSTS